MKMMLIWCILCSFFALASGLDVEFSYQTSCFTAGGTVEMTAKYTGSDTVTAVQWYYSGKTSQNLFVLTINCKAGLPIDAGYPPADRMDFNCNTATNVYKLTLSRVNADDFGKIWGATFSLSTAASPAVVQKQIKQCTIKYDCFWRDSLDSCLKCWGFLALIIVVILLVVIIIGSVVEAIFDIWESMSWEWRFVSFCVFLFGLGLYLCDYFKKWLKGKPAPPVITSQSNSPNPTSILVEWEKPSDRGYAILFYKITYQKVEFCCICCRNKIDVMVEKKDIKVTSFTIDNLRPGTYYEVKVYAINEKGSSSPGLKDFLTHSGKPDPPDITSQSNSPNPTSILVEWKEPSDRGYAIQSYEITYQKVEFCCRIKIDVMVEIKDIKETSFTIDNLSPGTYYEVKVYAINEKGSSSPGLMDFLTHSEDDGNSCAFWCCLAGACCLAGRCCVARAILRNANQQEEHALTEKV